MPYYTGVGSREAPPEILASMSRLAYKLALAGWTLRSGGAPGSDDAFEQGCDQASGSKDIFLPWKGFNGRTSPLYHGCEQSMELAATLHPVWEQLAPSHRKMHARNCYQVLGQSLADPSELLICWTSDGCDSERTRRRGTGGTATAIVLADRCGVPVFNLAKPRSRIALMEFLRARGVEVDRRLAANIQNELFDK